MGKFVTFITVDDCAHLRPPHITKEAFDAYYAGMEEHEVEARKTGRPSVGAGAIFPIADASLWIEPFPIPDWYEMAYGMDVGWNWTAAVVAARNPDTGQTFIVDNYKNSRSESVMHAHNIRGMFRENWALMGAIDPASEASSPVDGQKLLRIYRRLGLELKKANNAVASGLRHMRLMMQEDRLKVFDHCKPWMEEKRMYRRNEEGEIVKKNDHLMDATRYVLNTKGIWRPRPIASGDHDIMTGYGEF